jgi:hypothetical protein
MYSVGGKIVSVENKFPENKVNTLTFQVQGTQFPDHDLGFNNPNNWAYFDSPTTNSVSVNWGDGVNEVFEFGSFRQNYRIAWTGNGESEISRFPQGTLAGRHVYEDGNQGLRTITFTFRDLSKIEALHFNYTRLYGNFPKEIGQAKLLNEFEITNSKFITSLPESLIKNTNIKSFIFNRSFSEPLDKIPAGIFGNKVVQIGADNSFNLSDNISSNLFRIGELSETLETLEFYNCQINYLPDSFSLCQKLAYLRLDSNFIKNPEVLEPLFNLSYLTINVEYFENGLFETTNLKKIRFLGSKYLTENLISEIPLKWTGLKSLINFVRFQYVVRDNIVFQAFIENFYTLCTENGFLDPSSTEAQNTGFPEQFRDISWGDGNDWFTVTNPIQAPSGFSLGISNGTPANNAEKIYVLVENYGHTVELAP